MGRQDAEKGARLGESTEGYASEWRMNRECGGCDSRVARRLQRPPRLNSKYEHQDEVDDFGMMREGTSEGSTSLRKHHAGGDIRHMVEGRELGPQGDPPLPCQPLPPHCSSIGISGEVLSTPTASCHVRVMPKALSLQEPLAGTGFKTNQLGDRSSHPVDTGASGAEHEMKIHYSA